MHCSAYTETEIENSEGGRDFFCCWGNVNFNFGRVGFEVFGAIQIELTIRELTRAGDPIFRKEVWV